MKFHRHSNAYIGNVHLLVSNLEKSLDFYTDRLGFSILERDHDFISLTADGHTPLVSLTPNPNARPKQRTTGLYHFALLVPNRKDLAKAINRLAEANYPIEGGADHLFSEAIYLSDPDGNGIEIYADRPAEDWNWVDGVLPLVSNPLNIESLLQLAEGEIGEGLPPETVLGHIHLHVADLEGAKTFYVDGLGFDITIPFKHQALFVSTRGYHHHIGLNTWNGKGAPQPERDQVGMRWYTIIYATDDEREEVVGRLSEHGFQVKRDSDIVWTEDPSGNQIQLLIQ